MTIVVIYSVKRFLSDRPYNLFAILFKKGSKRDENSEMSHTVYLKGTYNFYFASTFDVVFRC